MTNHVQKNKLKKRTVNLKYLKNDVIFRLIISKIKIIKQ